MIIWLSGPYGVGKSTLAEHLASKMEGARIFDAEEVGNAVRDSYPDCPYGYVFEDYPLWGEFCCRLLKDVHETFRNDLIVPMTLMRKESFRILERLRQAGIDARLFILDASRETVRERILARGEKEGCWCMENIDVSRIGSAALPGQVIGTDHRTVEEIGASVLACLKRKGFHAEAGEDDPL